MPAGRRGGVILVDPGISGVFLKTGPGTPLGVASLNLNLNLQNAHAWDGQQGKCRPTVAY